MKLKTAAYTSMKRNNKSNLKLIQKKAKEM